MELVLAHKENNYCKIAIIGAGGFGKTTLAQKIHNDRKIKVSFELHAWISVSLDYNEVSLLNEVLRNIGVHHEQGESIAELHRKIAETLEGKSLFLVLDDVWHPNVWKKILRTPLHATTTNVILVTTRYKHITKRAGLGYTDRVDLMSVDVGWYMLLDEIVGTLYLSYDELPPRLKQCFLYCALYTEDSTTRHDEVTCKAKLLEYIAQEYYYELIHRNLLQPNKVFVNQVECKMHDLLRQLVEIKVRTFLAQHGLWRIEDTLFKRFIILRVLVLDYSPVQTIPYNIGKRIHLRLLNLHYTGVSCLPASIGSLKNIQVLSLRWRVDLHSLPLEITLLCNLRIGKLKFLTVLRGYHIGDGSDNDVVEYVWKLEELSSLTHMRYLCLVKLERVSHCSATEMLVDKRHMKKLVLECTKWRDGSYSEEIVSNTEVFGQLIPSSNLEDLTILVFNGRQYPTWFGTTCLSSLIYLKLIDGDDAVTKVGLEFVGCRIVDPTCNELVAFPQLECLWFFLEEEVTASERGDEIQKHDAQSARLQMIPRLVFLDLFNCPKLRALPRQLGENIASLKKLVLIRTNNLKVVDDFPHLTELLRIEDCEGLERISNLPQVTELFVYGCPK
ncbi:hypothetical protein ZWY2020_047381 [Hordeum vulgare]|nr:hypothetical protein ZWY2020_047381 [Hordeum vulgare]